MDNNIDDSDIDVDMNSVYSPPNNTGSPNRCLFESANYNLEKSILSVSGVEEQKPITKSSVLNELEGLMGSSHEYQGHWKFERASARVIQTKNMSSVENYMHNQAMNYPDQVFLFKKRGSRYSSDLNNSKITAIESGYSPVRFIDCKVRTSLKNSEHSNIQVKDSIEDGKGEDRQLTTFYLKKFNIFSNSSSLPIIPDDEFDDAVTPSPVSKRINKLNKGKFKENKKKNSDRRSRRRITCNCKNSGCVKLYCDCFSNNGFCGNACRCKDCKNTPVNTDRTLKALRSAQGNKTRFGFRIAKEAGVSQDAFDSKSCNCKKSQCLKNYCECYNYGVGCSRDCSCNDCRNSKPSL